MSEWTQPVHTGGRWIVADTPVDEMYPCTCEDVDPDPPAWKLERARRSGDGRVFRCDPYIAKKGPRTGRWSNRCHCWGMDPDGRPEGCCAYHEGNPRYAVVVDGTIVDPATPLPDKPGVEPPVEVADVELPPDDVPLELGQEYADETGDWPSIRMPYTPRWTHAERHCPCATPWDGEKAKVGFHCCADGCHQNFISWSASVAHHKDVTALCKDPARQVNIDGLQVYRPTTLRGHVVWA